MNYFRIVLFFAMLAPSISSAIDPAQAELLQEEQRPVPEVPNDELFKKPKDNEPVFPLDELISKPLKNNDKLFTDLMNMMATLGLIIGFILIVAWFLKRLVNTRMEKINENSSVDIIEKRLLSPKAMLYIIEVDNRRIILAESPQGITRIADYPAVSK